MSNKLLRLIGSKAVVLHDDPMAYDRLRWFKPHISKTAKLLDAGCGCGGFSVFAAKRCKSVTGISHDKEANNKAKQAAKALKINNTEFKSLDLRTLDQHKDKLDEYDQIICFETLEHIINDKAVIKGLSELLKPGGKIYITTPYKHYKPLLGDHIVPVENGGHVRWGYTHDEMEKLLNEVGIKVIKKDYISGFLSQQLTNLIRIISKLNPRLAWYSTLPLRLLLFPDKWITKILKYPHSSIGIIGEKVT